MPRATWKGYISFGLVSIPVSLYAGDSRSDLAFELVDVRDKARIRHRRINEVTGEEVPWEQIARAYPHSEGNYVVLEKEDFERASVEAKRTIAVDAFVDLPKIHPSVYERPYIAVPEQGGEKAYVLLREALRGTGKVGVGKVVMRGRQYLVGLLPDGNAIYALRMRFADEFIDPQSLNLPSGQMRDYGVSANELDMAEQLVQAMSSEWQPENYHDDYREALLRWIEMKVRVGDVAGAEPVQLAAEIEQPVNITELLQRSLEETRSR